MKFKKQILSVAALLVVTACVGRPPVGTGIGTTAAGGQAAVAVDALKPTGAVDVSIKWPRKTATIPGAASSVDIYAYAIGAAKETASASVTVPNSTASLSPLPAGPMRIVSLCWQAPSPIYNNNTKTLVSSGSVSVNVVANQHTPANVTMVDTDPPKITAIDPLFGFSGGSDQVSLSITGSGFAGFMQGAHVATVLLGTSTASLVFGEPNPFQSGTMHAVFPAGSHGPVSVLLDGLVATSSDVFTGIASISISSPSFSVTGNNATKSFSFTMYSDAAGTQPILGIGLPVGAYNVGGFVGGSECGKIGQPACHYTGSLTFNGTNVTYQSASTASAGMDHISLGQGTVMATIDITVN